MVDYKILQKSFARAGQGHIFKFWEQLSEADRHNLVRQATAIDLEEITRLTRELILHPTPLDLDPDSLKPAPYIPALSKSHDRASWTKATQIGEEALRAGKGAALTVAGGQGTRLGFDGPKGAFPVTPVLGKSLFQVLAEKIRAAATRYQTPLHWFIMTSPANHEQTARFLADHDYFQLDPKKIHLFSQGCMPAVDYEGKIILESPHAIAMSPDGHGGTFRALVRSGAVDTMRQFGIEVISTFQIDNPLVKVFDPAFIGFHLENDSEMSNKVVLKSDVEEKVGLFCLYEEKLLVLEYSDMPRALNEKREDSGQLSYRAGNTAMHLLSRAFVERVGSESDPRFKLPFHCAKKKIQTWDNTGKWVEPEKPNGNKFERFIFDALAFARKPIVVEVAREDEFSPVKNASGQDSPQTCRDDQLRQWTRWLQAAGESLETDDTGLPLFAFEISPLFANDEKTFVKKWCRLTRKPQLREGLYLSLD